MISRAKLSIRMERKLTIFHVDEVEKMLGCKCKNLVGWGMQSQQSALIFVGSSCLVNDVSRT